MLRIGNWRFDATLNQLSAGADIVALEPLASDVLEYLARRPNKVVSNDELTGNLWGRRLVGDSPVYRIIADLRRALGDDARTPTYIETIRKRGYRLVAQVTELGHDELVNDVIDQPAIEIVVAPPARSQKAVRFRNYYAAAAAILTISLAASSRLPLHATESTSNLKSDSITSLTNTARVKIQTNDLTGAEQALMVARSALTDAERTQSADYVSVVMLLANVKKLRSEFSSAYALYEEVLAIERSMYGDGRIEVAFALSAYAGAKMWNNEYVEAEKLTAQAADIAHRELTPRHPDRIQIDYQYGMALLRNGRIDQAAPILEESYRTQELVFGTGSYKLVDPLWNLAELKRNQNDLRAAAELNQKALHISLATVGKLHLTTAQSHEKLGIAYWRQGRLPEAEQELRSAIEVYRAVLPADNLYVCASEHFLGEVLLAEKRTADAIAQLNTTVARLERLHAHLWRIARTENTLGQAMIESGRFSEAKDYLERSYRQLLSDSHAAPELVQLAHKRLQALNL